MTTKNNSTEVMVEPKNKISKYFFFVFDMFLITTAGGSVFFKLFDSVLNKIFSDFPPYIELLLLCYLAFVLNPLSVWFAYLSLTQPEKKNKKKKNILFVNYIYYFLYF